MRKLIGRRLKLKKLAMKVSVFLVMCSLLLGSNVFTNQVYASGETMFYRALQVNNNRYMLNFWGQARELVQLDPDDPNVMPIIRDGSTMVPMRAMAGLMNHADGPVYFDVYWDAAENAAALFEASMADLDWFRMVAVFFIGYTEAAYFYNNEDFRVVDIPVAPVIIGGRTYLPLRAVADAVDFLEIEWVPEARGIVIYYSGSRPSNVTFPDGVTRSF